MSGQKDVTYIGWEVPVDLPSGCVFKPRVGKAWRCHLERTGAMGVNRPPRRELGARVGSPQYLTGNLKIRNKEDVLGDPL